MKENQIKGVEPFNKFLFRSCYYHQLIAGLACFGIQYEDILLSMFIFAEDDFEADTRTISEKGAEKILGFRSTRCNLTEKSLIRHIDRGHPVLVGVDCFFLESKQDTYRQKHDPHFVLIYGYNLRTRELNAVDHNYRNSYEYIEKILSMDNVLYANRMLGEGVLNRKTTCHVLKKRKAAGSMEKSFILQSYGAQAFKRSRECSMGNLNQLKAMIVGDLTALQENSERITRYLQEMKNHFRSLCYIPMFTDTVEKKVDLQNAVNAYSNLQSIFWRMENKKDFSFAYRNREQIFRRIDGLIEAESRIYGFIMEKLLCHLKK